VQALLISFVAVAFAEIGDKTQLLALVLAARYRRPWPICAGILVATLLNHALAGEAGVLLAQFSFSMGSAWDSMTGSATTTYGMVSYAGASAAGAFAPAVNAVLTIISTFGWWYGLKGFTQLRKASSGGGGGGYEDYAWKGFIHILGGAAMINIASTLDAFKETLGLTF